MELINTLTQKLTTKRLTLSDVNDVQALCVSCTDFSMLVDGVAPSEDAGLKILSDLPKGKKAEDKYVFGVYREHDLIAIIDLIKDYPTQDTWMLGLLMIHPDDRKQGLGHACSQSVERYVKDLGGTSIKIGVVQNNTIAKAFWEKAGYRVEGTFTYDTITDSQTAYSMSKAI
ncbi:hypothetical protein AOC36_06350 [Erysipelothrix larvae]|uniref:N-acetyltransferase domain-containing protein n=1 Tax=Erysipelothrix larvae TaxID=1514105 RepID=A0A0X8H088_9FIRM|nr:GNAT family N-acetyltransferase [Erysipelothrix larvae]AMC93619.1 hypothetical protein AOC36_06350 [Erysipelothrix larvae]